MKLSELKIEDGHFERISSSRDRIEAIFIDWQERTWLLRFPHALAFESISVEGEDIGELLVDSDDEWLSKIINTTEEDNTALNSFRFFSAWSGTCLLRVASEKCIVEEYTSDV